MQNKKQNGLAALVVIFILIFLIFPPTSSINSKFKDSVLPKKIFGSIGVNIDPVLADWAKENHFTDIVLRYQDNKQAAFELAESKGLTAWDWINWQDFIGSGDYSPAYFRDRAAYFKSSSPSGKYIIDDFNDAFTELNQAQTTYLLDSLSSDNSIALAVHVFNQIDLNNLKPYAGKFKGITLIAYNLPSNLWDENTVSVLKSLDADEVIYTLWAYTGYDVMGVYPDGKDWTQLSQESISAVYQKAEELNCNGVFVFEILNAGEYEHGMHGASLYNYPDKWDIISTLNQQFLDG